MKQGSISVKGQVFPVLIAASDHERRQGLMWQEWPPPIMAFPYEKPSFNKFWMKNTISPLDIVFCKGSSVIGVFKGEPLSTTLVGPNEASDLIVEFPAGTADRLGIKPGDYVGFCRTS